MATFNLTTGAGQTIQGHIESGGPASPTGPTVGSRPFPPPPAEEANPSNVEDDLGMYHRVHVNADGNVVYSRSDQVSPPFDWVTEATDGGDDTFPAIAREASERLLLVFQRGPDVWLVTSDDDGRTWNDPEMAIPGGSKPRIAVGGGEIGTIIVGALVGTNIYVTRQAPGDPTPSDPAAIVDSTETPIEVEDDTFDFDQARSGDAPWVLVCVKAGDTEPTEFQSWDELVSADEV